MAFRIQGRLFRPSQIRGVCCLLLHETDEAKVHELAKALREMIAFNVEEMRSKVEFVAKHYPEPDDSSDEAAA